MSLLGKWKVIEDRKKLKLKYGENATIVRRLAPKAAGTVQPHSFPHLIDVKFTVPQPKWRPVESPGQRVTTYGITEAERTSQSARTRRGHESRKKLAFVGEES